MQCLALRVFVELNPVNLKGDCGWKDTLAQIVDIFADKRHSNV